MLRGGSRTDAKRSWRVVVCSRVRHRLFGRHNVCAQVLFDPLREDSRKTGSPVYCHSRVAWRMPNQATAPCNFSRSVSVNTGPILSHEKVPWVTIIRLAFLDLQSRKFQKLLVTFLWSGSSKSPVCYATSRIRDITGTICGGYAVSSKSISSPLPNPTMSIMSTIVNTSGLVST
jgi:hypothetical protein